MDIHVIDYVYNVFDYNTCFDVTYNVFSFGNVTEGGRINGKGKNVCKRCS